MVKGKTKENAKKKVKERVILTYFLNVAPGSDEYVGKKVKEMEGLDSIRFALSGGVLPCDGYVAQFIVPLEEATVLGDALLGIKGVRDTKLLYQANTR